MTREWFARAPRAPEIDLELYAYDAPFDRPDAGEDAEEDAPEDSGAYALADQDFVDDWDPWGDEEEDDDALLAVLEEALDEVAEEERVAAIKAAASPEADTVEIAPEPGTLYRDAISALLGQPRRPSAPATPRSRCARPGARARSRGCCKTACSGPAAAWSAGGRRGGRATCHLTAR